jgi:hypothetical protein
MNESDHTGRTYTAAITMAARVALGIQKNAGVTRYNAPITIPPVIIPFAGVRTPA